MKKSLKKKTIIKKWSLGKYGINGGEEVIKLIKIEGFYRINLD